MTTSRWYTCCSKETETFKATVLNMFKDLEEDTVIQAYGTYNCGNNSYKKDQNGDSRTEKNRN